MIMSDIALSVENLKIVYMPYHSMQIRNLLGGGQTKLKPIEAVRDLSFSVNKGEVVGIVGKNGSGKTTLLRAIAGVFAPDEGRIDLHGSRVSLMALGVGFDPELSGRENIVLSGMMLGFSRREIRERLEEIVAFSELNEFIDYPVRTYSSGMYSKLAFSITSFLETDIMLIDEVLSVGDLAFQEKSRKRMRALIAEHRHTVLIVSHNIGLLQDVCDRVLWMDRGTLRCMGEAKQILREYNDLMLDRKSAGGSAAETGEGEDRHVWLFGSWEDDWKRASEAVPELRECFEGELDQWVNQDFRKLEKKTVVLAGGYFTHNSAKLKEMYDLKDEQILSFRSWLGTKLSDPDTEIRPVRVRLEASTVCQLNCRDCYMRKENSGIVGTGLLTLAHFRQFLSENPYVREIELSNSGEVFLNPELIGILQHAYEKKVGITLGNGVNLNTASEEQLEALVKYGVRYISVSIDGATQEVYAEYRRNGDLNQVLANIRSINRFKKKYRSETPELQWQFVVFEHNRHEKEKAEAMAEELGMKFRLKQDWGGYREQEEYEAAGSGGAAEPSGSGEAGGFEGSGGSDGSDAEAVEISGDCAQMLFSPQINWDGRLLGCCRVFKEEWGVNVFETHSLSEALKNKLYRQGLCSHLKRTSLPDGDMPCLHCDDKNKFLI